MKIEVRLDPEYAEPKLLILADSMSEEVERILRLLRSEPDGLLVGFRREGASPLEEGASSRIYAQQGRSAPRRTPANMSSARGSTSWRRSSPQRVSSAYPTRSS